MPTGSNAACRTLFILVSNFLEMLEMLLHNIIITTKNSELPAVSYYPRHGTCKAYVQSEHRLESNLGARIFKPITKHRSLNYSH